MPRDEAGRADDAEFPGCTGLHRATVVHRDGTVALDDVTLLARPGELLAVLGPSGSGKTTLLRAIAGLAKVRKGRVLIAGEPTKLDPAYRDVAMVFEQTQLMPTLDVARNMGFGLESRQVPAPEVRRRVDQEARRLRVNRLLRRRPTQLSSGEKGQVGIGRALVRRPRAFLLDEPLAHIDVQERARMRRVIAETVKASRVSTVYVTHDQSDALAIGDRIAVLNAGRVVQVGPPRELYDRPADLFIADFVGSSSIGTLRGRLVASGGLAGFRVGDRTLPTWQPVPPALVAWIDRDVLLGLRPEDVQQAEREPHPDRPQLTGRVRAIDRTGRDAFLTIDVAGAGLVARFAGRSGARVGDAVTVSVDVARAHVFDPATLRAVHHPAYPDGHSPAAGS